MPSPFLAGLIDYAGLFPPAGLPLADAAANYLRYLAGPDAWMLGRFVCPAGQIAALDALLPAEAPVRLAVLPTGGPDAEAFFATFEADLAASRAFQDLRGPHAGVDLLEIRLPDALLDPFEPGDILRFLERLPRHVDDAGLAVERLFIEGPVLDPDDPRTGLLVGLLHDAGAGRFGFKIRTGGLHVDDFPAPDALAEAIVACRDAGVPLKATAGLHHPVRSHRAEVGGAMHGFLNVFGAGVLAHARGLDRETLAALLSDTDPTHFTLSDAGFAWSGYHATPTEITHARSFATSFGSCSFDEPREELAGLGL
ncbi:MAG: hypothetical protein SH809_07355 [Rhodothermales bacterium]|nr:hypothetical protein [Rhodothermales bacterium]